MRCAPRRPRPVAGRGGTPPRGCRVGQQAGRGQHVVVVDHDPRAPGAAASRPRRLAGAAAEHPLGDAGPAVAQHATGPDQQVDLAQVLAGALDHAAVGADHDLAAAGVPAQGEADRARSRWPRPRRTRRRSSGRKPGSACRTLGRARPGRRAPAAGDGRGRPTSACRGRPRRSGSRASWRPPRGRGVGLLGVELDHRVHVGGGAADVDDDDVAGARRSLEPGPAARRR